MRPESVTESRGVYMGLILGRRCEMLLAAILVFTGAGCSVEWRDVTSDDGVCSVSMPGRADVGRVQKAAGRWSGQTFRLETNRGLLNYLSPRPSAMYWASFEEIPQPLDAAEVVEHYVQERAQAFASKPKVVRTGVSTSGLDGTQIEVDDGHVKALIRIYVVGQQACVTEVMAAPEALVEADVRRFTDSFRVNHR